MAVSSSLHHSFVTGALALAGILSADLGSALAADGLFGHLSGYWSGTGTVTMNNGSSDRIRCKASYAVGQGGNALEQNLRCASDSYKMQVNANVISSGGSISGTWSEATRNVTGNLSGTASGSEVRANVAGMGFTASLNLATKGDKQIVTIKPQGATDIVNVSIALRKE
jgi:hypothetical protein